MDDESKELLRQLLDAQKEQTELLRKHVLPLWTRIRFSLLALFVLMTLMATGVGFTVLAIRSTNAPASATTATATGVFAPVTGTLRLSSPTKPSFFLETRPSATAEFSDGPQANPTTLPAGFSEN
jgi:hypothetical protein